MYSVTSVGAINIMCFPNLVVNFIYITLRVYVQTLRLVIQIDVNKQIQILEVEGLTRCTCVTYKMTNF